MSIAKERVLSAVGDGGFDRPDPEATTLSARFAEVIERFGSKPALNSGGRSWTYTQIGHAAACIADRLLETDGQDNRSPVGLLLDQGLDFYAGVFGTVSAARPFVPLDPTYPADRLSAMREDAGLRRVACTADHLDLARAAGFSRNQLLVVDRGAVDTDATYSAGQSVPTDPAWILFTSGSTGRPKGVIQTHRSAVHNYGRFVEHFAVSPDDRQSLVYPTSVYGGLRDLLNAALTGATLCHYPLRDAGYAGLPDWLRQQRCTIYCSVASVFRRFTRTVETAGTFPDVRLIKLGGETIHPEDLRQFQRLFDEDCHLFAGLASTETGQTVFRPIGANEQLGDTGTVPLGQPVDGVEVLIVDDQRKPIEGDQVGEIAVRSRYLTEGYLGREDLTANVLTRDADDPDLQTFYTGDLGVFDEHGRLLHRGRKDHQVKVRGNRVELAEVESALQALPEIHDAAVIPETDSFGDTRLIAYLVFELRRDREPDVGSLREALRTRLPSFALPAVFIALTEMPVTPNGKVNRRALPDCDGRRLSSDISGNPPVGATETQLAELFTQTLGEPLLDVNAGFFELGGDSLRAVDLILRIEKYFGRELALTDLTKRPSVRALADMLGDAANADSHPILVPLRPEGDRPPLFVLSGRGGSVTCYAKLLPHLPEDQPVLGLQLPGVAPGTEPIDDAVALAGVLKDVIVSAAPTGPIRLLGYSFGGLLAFEIARQLDAEGRRPQWVGIVDHHAAGSRRKLPKRQRFAIRVDMLARQGWGDRVGWAADRVRRWTGRSTDKPDIVPPGQEALLARLRKVNAASVRAGRSYTYGRYGGSVEVFACRHRHDYERFFRVDEDRGWSTYAHVRKVRRIDGRHLEVFHETNVASLGAEVSTALASLTAESARAASSGMDSEPDTAR
ncbi:MAG: alpha/beta fold hydrolase [Planctomycetota bacterium]